jgi:hypothetical protein
VQRFTNHTRCRLDVIATSVAEVAQSAGGWLFDRAMAGWEITVLVDELRESPLPLQILGAEVVDLDATAQRAGGRRARPAALAVAADLYGGNSRIQQSTRSAVESGRIEVTMWGKTHSVETICTGYLEYRPSVAARAFKARALAAAGLPADAHPTVELYRNGLAALPRP